MKQFLKFKPMHMHHAKRALCSYTVHSAPHTHTLIHTFKRNVVDVPVQKLCRLKSDNNIDLRFVLSIIKNLT